LVGYVGAKPRAGQTVGVQVAGVGSVPATGVGAVAVNVTVVDPAGPGFVTAFPGGAGRPGTSSVNVERSGQTVSNSAVVPVGADGTIDLFTSNAANLLVDVTGWFPA
jgi:hypothetical protein